MASPPSASPTAPDPALGPPGSAVGGGLPLRERLASDPQALAECYRTLGPMVLAYLGRMVGKEEAEDVLQQVFLEVWRSRESYDSARRLEPWVIGIAHKRAVDHLRRRSRRDGLPIVSLSPPDAVSTDRFVDDFAEAEEVASALAQLSTEQRETLVLAYFNGLTQTQIAHRLGVPVGTVKARSHRGLRRLAAILVPEVEI